MTAGVRFIHARGIIIDSTIHYDVGEHHGRAITVKASPRLR